VRELREAARRAGVELVVLHGAPSTSQQRNRGIQHVQTPLTLLLDDDVTLQPDYAEVLLERWAKDGLEAFGAIVGSQLILERQRWLARLLRMVSMLHYDALRSSSTSFRRSRKLRFVPVPTHEVVVPACGAGYGLFRTKLLRRHPFDERFPGYAPGEDHDMSSRLSSEAPILQLPSARWAHDEHPHERVSVARWRQRGRTETYFRLRHLEPTLLCRTAFALSLVTEALIATAYSLRHRDGHVLGYIGGVLETLRERDYRHERPPREAPERRRLAAWPR
jgi:GT2 family glycosyltransferase